MFRGRLATWPATPLAVAAVRLYGGAILLYGLVIIAQGPARWSGPAYATATALASPPVWGAIIAVLGVAILAGSITGRFWLRNIGLYGAAVWLGFFAITILLEALTSSRLSLSGVILYGLIAGHLCIVARAREDRP